MASLAALLAEVVAGQKLLRRQRVVDGSLAHNTEAIGRDLNRGYGPGRAAPALVDWLGYVITPDVTEIVRLSQRTSLKRGF